MHHRAQYPVGRIIDDTSKAPSVLNLECTPFADTKSISGFEFALPSQGLDSPQMSLAVSRTLPLGDLKTTCLNPRKPPRCMPR